MLMSIRHPVKNFLLNTPTNRELTHQTCPANCPSKKRQDQPTADEGRAKKRRMRDIRNDIIVNNIQNIFDLASAIPVIFGAEARLSLPLTLELLRLEEPLLPEALTDPLARCLLPEPLDGLKGSEPRLGVGRIGELSGEGEGGK